VREEPGLAKSVGRKTFRNDGVPLGGKKSLKAYPGKHGKKKTYFEERQIFLANIGNGSFLKG